MKKTLLYLAITIIITMLIFACDKKEIQTENQLVGKWVTNSYHAGNNDTIVLDNNSSVQLYFDYIYENQVIPAMYLYPFATYLISDDNITFTIHYSYPKAENIDETFKYSLTNNKLTIKGFSNPFSDTLEGRSDVHFTKIE